MESTETSEIRVGSTVTLASVHPNMNARLKGWLGKSGVVAWVMDDTACVMFDRGPTRQGTFRIKTRYLDVRG
jgi:hypothetical protein